MAQRYCLDAQQGNEWPWNNDCNKDYCCFSTLGQWLVFSICCRAKNNTQTRAITCTAANVLNTLYGDAYHLQHTPIQSL